MNNLTERQRMLLEIAITNLDNLADIVGVEAFMQELDYDDNEDGNLSILANDIREEFKI